MQELTLSEIWVYPIKGLGGTRQASSKVLDKGLEFDRRMMLVDQDNRFMTQRTSSKLALLKTSLRDGEVVVSAGESEIVIGRIEGGEEIRTMVWKDDVSVIETDSRYHSWFSEQIGLDCKLVYFPEDYSRPVNPNQKDSDKHVSLADGYPFLILGQGTLDHLNSKLDVALPMNRFRPNLVFTGGRAHEEDTWREFSIGTNRFRGVKPCARCSVTTINQDTGYKGVEPLRTLSSYRRVGNDVFFGQNVLAVDHGVIHEGDMIRVNSYAHEEISLQLNTHL